ncbi:hypothetical protein ACP70R_016694 [Stipagrostis hirtigluma subsp. patula]
MPKRHRSEQSDDDGGDRVSRRPCIRCPPQRRLCVVLDDWSKGYSIYKLDVDGFDDDYFDQRAERLPDPPRFRLEIPDGDPHDDKGAPVLVYDAATGALAVGPATPIELWNRPELVPAGGDRVYALDRGAGRNHLKILAWHGGRGWAWDTLPDAPFDAGTATACHAAHPDGRTVFFSSHGAGTFSFDAGTGAWAWHGEWMLPFRGQAHYDAEVDAWVGLCRGAASPGLRSRRAPCRRRQRRRGRHGGAPAAGVEARRGGDGTRGQNRSRARAHGTRRVLPRGMPELERRA